MNKIIVQSQQSILDICFIAYGNIDSLVLLLLENALSITDELLPGTELKIPEVDTADSDIVNFYTRKSIKPATAFTELPVVNPWILADTTWNDLGIWIDTETWND